MKCRFRFRRLDSVVAALLFGIAGTRAQGATGTAVVEFKHPQYTVQPNARAATMALVRSGSTNASVTVDFTTTDETAIAGEDYTAKSGPITFAAGQTEESVSVPVRSDAPRKAKKTVRLSLSNPTDGATLGARSTAQLLLPKVWPTAWLNFGLDKIEPLKETWFDIPIWQYIASLIYIFLAFYVSKLLDFLIRGRLRQWARKTPTQVDDLLLELLRGPIKVVAFVIFLHIGLRVFAWPDWLGNVISKTLHVIVAVSLTYMAFKGVDALSGYWKQRISGHEDKPFSDQLLPIIRNSLKVFIVVVAVLLTLQNMGLNVTSLIASLSIGGLAISLAAQDTLANLFGAVAVLTDKPFLIGDRIKLDAVEGTVESVGLRSTRVRTADGNLVSIPNKTVGNATITKLAGGDVPKPPVKPGATAA